MDTSPEARNERCRTNSTRENQLQRILVGWGAADWIPDWTRLAIRTWYSYYSYSCMTSLVPTNMIVPVVNVMDECIYLVSRATR